MSGGDGEIDSGGQHPSGAWIKIACPSCNGTGEVPTSGDPACACGGEGRRWRPSTSGFNLVSEPCPDCAPSLATPVEQAAESRQQTCFCCRDDGCREDGCLCAAPASPPEPVEQRSYTLADLRGLWADGPTTAEWSAWLRRGTPLPDAQPEGEPVTWRGENGGTWEFTIYANIAGNWSDAGWNVEPLYAGPPPITHDDAYVEVVAGEMAKAADSIGLFDRLTREEADAVVALERDCVDLIYFWTRDSGVVPSSVVQYVTERMARDSHGVDAKYSDVERIEAARAAWALPMTNAERRCGGTSPDAIRAALAKLGGKA